MIEVHWRGDADTEFAEAVVAFLVNPETPDRRWDVEVTQHSLASYAVTRGRLVDFSRVTGRDGDSRPVLVIAPNDHGDEVFVHLHDIKKLVVI